MKYDDESPLPEHAHTHPAYRAFARAMEDKQYGREPLQNAWGWFRAGWDAAVAHDAKLDELARPVVASAIIEARDEGHAAGRAEATSLVIGHLAELARMDRVPCRHYRECNCREVLDREQVMTEVMAIKRALAGKL